MTEITSRLTTALADRYRIEGRIGEGGMATVYLAEDLKHKRKVALKVLKPELSAVLGGERFLNEITVTANLHHPHILQLYDSGEAGDELGRGMPRPFLFYVMPYVEGESLRDKLNREKQLAIEDTIAITKVIASALDFAHKRDVIHRDIKPENILLQDGVALVADFGIAIAVSSAGGDRLTETGLSLGTPAYMSPEQVSGERDLDARSDVYSLACMTYEMLAGDPPFVASTTRAVMAKHVTDPAPPITTTRPSVTPAIAKALAKALSKARADRYGSAGAFAAGLTDEHVADDRDTKAIVVLPFANLSPDPDNEYFSDGLTEEIITDLSKIQALNVISRNSAMQLKGTDKDTKTIGRELNVRYVLEGSVRKAGDNLRITAQLIDAEGDVHLWADKFSGTLDDVFDIQEQVSRKIADALVLTLSPEEEQRIAERPITDVRAYEYYLQGRFESARLTPEGLSRAIQHYQDGLAIVGENALLYTGLGYAYLFYGGVVFEQKATHGERARTAAKRALELDPDSAKAHALLALIHNDHFEFEDVFPNLNRALELDPKDVDGLMLSAIVSTWVGKTDRGQRHARALMEIDPLNPLAALFLTIADLLGGESAAAITRCEKHLQADPNNAPMRTVYAWALAFSGRRDEAVAVLDRLESETTEFFETIGVVLRHALKGDKQQALDAITDTFLSHTRTDPQFSWFLSGCYALLDEQGEAVTWLENAVRGGLKNYPLVAEHDPFLARLRGHPRFEVLLERIKHEWETFEA